MPHLNLSSTSLGHLAKSVWPTIEQSGDEPGPSSQTLSYRPSFSVKIKKDASVGQWGAGGIHLTSRYYHHENHYAAITGT